MNSNSDRSVADIIRDAVKRVHAGDGQSLADAVLAVPASAITTFLHANFEAGSEGVHLTTGIAASPGAASGAVVLDAESAIEAADDGRAVILVRRETTPDDVLGMQSARGILTTNGGITSHAAVVARGWGIPAVVGAGELVIDETGLRVGERHIEPGTQISINGSTGEVFLGAAETSTEQAPAELATLLDWADQIRLAAETVVAVLANADNAADSAHARRMGAEGIGLCRTEHMFLAAERLPLVRRLILTDDPDVERHALADLEAAQQVDFEGILAEMAGLPVTIRLLDPPLHEFLPDFMQLVAAEARGELDGDGHLELAAVRRLHEVNPMIGTRGVRLGVVRPGLYEMQVRALLRAVMTAGSLGHEPNVEVMIPLVVDPSEMRLAREWVADAARDVAFVGHVGVGAMLETPRAALLAGELAEVSDFFSFGTNDLTQLIFGFSRDDVGSKLIPDYLRAGLLESDPFESLDEAGVGRIIRFACENARATNPTMRIGVCGEQAGDPESAKMLVTYGVDYVSCSPYRVPVARLAVAQALVENHRISLDALSAISRAWSTTHPEPGNDPAGSGTAGVDTASAQPDASAESGAGDAPQALEFLVLHALRIKGFSGVDTLADIAGVGANVVTPMLSKLAEVGMCKHLEARGLWQLTPAGREHHLAIRPEMPASQVERISAHYEPFLEFNLGFKDLCNRWQMRCAEPNDHSDSEFDQARIGELQQMHGKAVVHLRGFAAELPRFETYERRLAIALAKLTDGDTRMFTGVMCGSYHDVWMELHEDLVQLLGVDRHAEGSY